MNSCALRAGLIVAIFGLGVVQGQNVAAQDVQVNPPDQPWVSGGDAPQDFIRGLEDQLVSIGGEIGRLESEQVLLSLDATKAEEAAAKQEVLEAKKAERDQIIKILNLLQIPENPPPVELAEPWTTHSCDFNNASQSTCEALEAWKGPDSDWGSAAVGDGQSAFDKYLSVQGGSPLGADQQL